MSKQCLPNTSQQSRQVTTRIQDTLKHILLKKAQTYIKMNFTFLLKIKVLFNTKN